METECCGFISYAHEDDDEAGGKFITKLKEALEREVGIQMGRPRRIFKDDRDIPPGELWERRIGALLGSVPVVIPVLTPNFFRSRYCAREVLLAAEEEERSHRVIIVPIVLLRVALLNEPTALAAAPSDTRKLAETIARHQYVDARELYGIPPGMLFQDVRARPLVQDIAKRIADLVAAHERTGHFPVRDVAPKGATFTRISDALRDAPAGARILVAPGEYQEQLLIDRPVEIAGRMEPGIATSRRSAGPLGAGPGQQVRILGAGGPTVVFSAPFGRLFNLVLAPGPSTGPSNVVLVRNGHLDISRCDLSGSGFACLAVRGRASVQVSSSLIHHSAQGGILFEEESSGSVSTCSIHSNKHSGVHVQGRSDPLVLDSIIHGNDAVGIFVYDDARPTLRRNLVSLNKSGGLLVTDRSDPVVAFNRIERNRSHGVILSTSARAKFVGNHIAGNKNWGVLVEDGAAPFFHRNRIERNVGAALAFQRGGGGHFTRCRIDQPECSVRVIGGSPRIERSRFSPCERLVDGYLSEDNFRLNVLEQADGRHRAITVRGVD